MGRPNLFKSFWYGKPVNLRVMILKCFVEQLQCSVTIGKLLFHIWKKVKDLQ